MTDLTDQELLLRLRNLEDNFVERKAVSDYKDWLKTVFDFANSVPIGYPAVLFIGVKNDATVQDGVKQRFTPGSFGDSAGRLWAALSIHRPHWLG